MWRGLIGRAGRCIVFCIWLAVCLDTRQVMRDGSIAPTNPQHEDAKR